MFRRRIIPPMRRPFLRRGIAGRPPIPPKLIEANRLFKNGEFEKSAELYEELANKALEMQIPQAPRLFIQAGAARIKADQIEMGMEIIKRGLTLLVERQQWGELRQMSDASVGRLRDSGKNDLANELKAWIESKIPAEIKKSPEWIKGGVGPRKQIQLPIHCPSCGGPVNPNEVDWFDSQNAACGYCGSLITGE